MYLLLAFHPIYVWQGVTSKFTGMIQTDSESSDEAPPRKLTETGLTFSDEFIYILET